VIFTLSIDLDPLQCYAKIYGLEFPQGPDPLVAPALERFIELCQELGIKGTIFVVGQTLQEERLANWVKSAFQAGHEIANHSYSHPYELSHLAVGEIKNEIEQTNAAVESVTGRRPRGFRAPGYLLGKHALGVLEELDFTYDSSVLPSPFYQGLKALVRAVLDLSGKKSQSLPGSFSESLAPTRPYRPDVKNPWRRGGANLLEIPIGTLGRLPLLGGVLSLAGEGLSSLLGAMAARGAFVHLQLHAADLVDIHSDHLPKELGLQPDFKIPWQKKARAITAFLRNLSSSHRPMTLSQVAETLSG